MLKKLMVTHYESQDGVDCDNSGYGRYSLCIKFDSH